MPVNISTAIIDNSLVYMTSCSLKCSQDGKFSRFEKTPAKKTLLPCFSVYTQEINGTQIWEDTKHCSHLACLVSPPPFSAVQVSAVCPPVQLLCSTAFHSGINLVNVNRLSASLSFHLAPGLCKWKLMTHKDCSGTGSSDSRENITMAFPKRANMVP